jgi:hypothetical protein
MTKLTNNEVEFLKAFGTSDLYDGLDSSIWKFDIVERLSPTLSDQNIGKAILSLEKKGIILLESSGTEIYITLTDEAQENTIITEIVDKKRSKAQEEEYIRILEEEAPEPTEEVKPVVKKTVKKKASTKEDKETTKVETAIRNTDSQEGFSTVESTWIDRTERRDFEKLYLETLGTKYDCEISVARNKETNKDSYIVIGDEKNREKLITEFSFVLPNIRKQAHEEYLKSNRSLSEFKFTTSYNNTFLESIK